MFLKRRHLEALKSKKADSTTLLELYILGLTDSTGEEFNLTEAGRRLAELAERIGETPELFADTEIIKMLELGVKTGYLPDRWGEILEERKLAEKANGYAVNDFGRELLDIYRSTHPRLYLTAEIVAFIRGLPKVGEYDELVAYRDTCNVGENIINALQAMRMLLISPVTEGKAFSKTKAADLALNVAKYTNFERPVILDAADAETLKGGKSTGDKAGSKMQDLKERGLWKDSVTELGKAALETYDAIGVEERKLYPMYLLEDEIEVIKAIKEVERIHENTPSILPTYSEVERRAKVSDLGATLHLLESKELVERRLIDGKDTYWTTEWSFITEFGAFTSDGVKALTYSLSGDVPAFEWVRRAKEESLLSNGITKKGKEVLRFTEKMERRPYLTKYDVAILAKIPRKYVVKDELIKEISETYGMSEADITRAISESEAKGWIEELQNHVVCLTKLGEGMKDVVEKAKTKELLSVKFAVTPTTYNVLKVIYENIEVFNRIWKESSEIRNYKQDEVDFIKKKLSLSDEEIKKALTVLRAIGLLGRKNLTEAGRKLVEIYAS